MLEAISFLILVDYYYYDVIIGHQALGYGPMGPKIQNDHILIKIALYDVFSNCAFTKHAFGNVTTCYHIVKSPGTQYQTPGLQGPATWGPKMQICHISIAICLT